MERNFVLIFASVALILQTANCKNLNNHPTFVYAKRSRSNPQVKAAETCNPDGGFIIINTIDGNLTALDPKSGNICWKIKVNPLGLISSSLEKLQVFDNGANIRLVPSLDGRLFKYEEGKLEPLPITADSMLKSTSKIGDNLSIIGEREKKVYGFNLFSGEVCYECTSKECNHFCNISENVTVLVVEQIAHSVNAVNSQKGISQWNFRVAELQLAIASDPINTFNDDASLYENALVAEKNFNEDHLMSTIKIAMNGGYIGIFNEPSNTFDWLQKLSNPIIDVWYAKGKTIQPLDQFDQNSQFLFSSGHNRKSVASLFIGTFKNQLFIKQSRKLKTRSTDVKMQSNEAPCSGKHEVSRMSPFDKDAAETLFQEETSLIPIQKVEEAATFTHGVYYYINYSTIINSTHCVVNGSFPMAVLYVWESNPLTTWFSVIVATIILTVTSTVIIFRVFLKSKDSFMTNNLLTEVNVSADNIYDSVDVPNASTEKQYTMEPEFVSRFLQDFVVIKTLGKGGFGLVIEAKNNIDDCCYAVKRIPYFEDKTGENMFTKVMREVKALAMLDHPGIVRYFNAWTEVPPEGWQENKDSEHHISDSYSEFSSASLAKVISSTTRPKKVRLRNAINNNPLRLVDFCDNTSSSDDAEKKILSSESNSEFSSVSLAKVISSTTHPKKVRLRNALNNNPLQLVDFCDNSSSSDDAEEKVLSPSTCDTSETSCVAYLYIQMQLCLKDTLRDWLTKNDSVRNRDDVLRMFNQIVVAVDYVHQRGLMHRDLKPSNIFFSLDGNIKIGDFGLAATTNAMVEECDTSVCGSSSNVRTKHVGTYLYMSPEQRVRKSYDSKTDIFALGIIFFELLVPFHSGMERIEVINKVRKLQFPKEFISDFESEHKLAKTMLHPDPQNRPSAFEIRNYHLFS